MHNPLLMVGGITDFKSEDEESKIFIEEYNKAILQAKPECICPGLTFDHSAEDLGYGGLTNNIKAPFFSPLNVRSIKKDFGYYWPKDYRSDKYMKYIGAVNLKVWPIFLKLFTDFKEPLSPYIGYRDLRKSSYSKSVLENTNYWLYLFVSNGKYEESYVPNCHVRLVEHYNGPHYVEDKPISDEEVQAAMLSWNEEMTVKTEIEYNKGYFTEPKLRFYYDGLTNASDRDYDGEKGIFSNDGDYKVFGKFSSQQEPKRELSPNRYLFPRALTPIFSYTDCVHDVTHQFTADSFLFDDIKHQGYYCRLDSSCT